MKLKLILMPLVMLCLGACGGDEPESSSKNDRDPEVETREVKPVVKIITDASTTDTFTVSFRVKSVSKPSVTLSWSAEKGKTSSPRYNKSGSVNRTYDEVSMSNGRYTEYYYKVTHAGFSPGDYVYYKIEASNSKGDDSANGYVIIKR